VTETCGWQAGNWRRRFSQQAVIIWQADCLIAAATLRLNATLATGNSKDFPMAELTVEHRPAGE
jgi:predicted nucleic acid-binding protein